MRFTPVRKTLGGRCVVEQWIDPAISGFDPIPGGASN